MTRSDELNAEIRNQAVRLYPKCAGLFELPLMVYTQIVADKGGRLVFHDTNAYHSYQLVRFVSLGMQ